MKKYVSLILCVVMLIGIIPTIHASADQVYVIEPQYDDAGSFKENLAAVKVNNKWGFIDNTGKEIVKPQYEKVYDFSEGLAAVQVNGKWGFINNTGKEIINFQYDDVGSFIEHLAAVKVNSKWGFIDKTGKEIVKPQYEKVYDFSEGLAAVQVNGKWGFIDNSGKVIINFQYNNAVYSFSEGLAPVSVGNVFGRKWGFIDKTGNVVVDLQYDGYALSFSEGLAGVCSENAMNNKCGFITKTGKKVINFKYQNVYYFSEGLALVDAGDFLTHKYGFIDKTGNEVVKPQYNDAWTKFSEGLASIEKDGKWGFIDKSGQEVVMPQYDTANSFTEGLAAVKVNGKWGFIVNPVNDTPAEWAKHEVDAAVSLNLVPKDMRNRYVYKITRTDFSRLIVNLLTVKTGKSIDALLAANGKKIDPTVFKDTTDRTILAANALGIVSGKGDGQFDPNGDITRQEAAVMLAKTAKVLGLNASGTGPEYADLTDVASWAKDAVTFVSSTEDRTIHTKIMGSTGDNNFSPYASYTRQQGFITMKRLFNAN